MTSEEKDLLLKDLCSRLPYGVKYMDILNPDEHPSTLQSIDNCGLVMANDGFSHEIENVKPYLFPMSSMTEEQRNEFDTQTFTIMFGECICKKNDEMAYGKLMKFDLDFYNKHHLDWIGLIPMGLAIDATNLNIY